MENMISSHFGSLIIDGKIKLKIDLFQMVPGVTEMAVRLAKSPLSW